MIRYQGIDPSVTHDNMHPDAVFREELVLARHFSEAAPGEHGIDACPVTGSARYEVFFEKWGRSYAFCPETWSLSLASLPSADILRDYFLQSDLSRLRASDAYQLQLTASRRRMWEHLADWAQGRVHRYLAKDAVSVIDWGPKALGWSELLGQAKWVSEYAIAESLPPLEPTELPQGADLVCLFDVIQRSTDPASILRLAADRLVPGGLLLTSCRSGSGFDVLTLGGASDSIFPFDHICLPSLQGMQQLIHRAGLELLELTTPGMLDVQLVRAAEHDLPRNRYFQRYLLAHGSPEMDERLQLFLQQNNLSSHMRVVARKPPEVA